MIYIEWEEPANVLEGVEALKNCVISRSTGGSGAHYRELREYIRGFADIWELLPKAVRTSRNDNEIWAYIKSKFGKYDERREFWRNEFEHVLDYLERRQGVQKEVRGKPIDDKPSTNEQGRSQCVALIVGRDASANECAKKLIQAMGLIPVDFEFAKAMGTKGHEYIHEIIDRMFAECASALVVLSPDEEASLAPSLQKSSQDRKFRRQPRPNVLFEYGIAIGKYEESVIVLQFGDVEFHSDILGLHSFWWKGWKETFDEVEKRYRNMNLPLTLNTPDVLPDYVTGPPDPTLSIFEDKWNQLDEDSKLALKALVEEGVYQIPEFSIRAALVDRHGVNIDHIHPRVTNARARLEKIGLINAEISTNGNTTWTVRSIFREHARRAIQNM